MVCSLSRSRMYKRRGANWARHDRHARAAPRPKVGMQRRGNSARSYRNDGTHPVHRDGSRADCFSNPRRGGGAGEIGGAERRKRICNGVGEGREGGDGASRAASSCSIPSSMLAIIRARWQTRPLSRRAKRRSSAAPVRCKKSMPASSIPQT